MPQRIQRKRTKGWRMPDGAVYIGRPTKWGNKFRVGGHYKRDGGGVPRCGLSFIYLEAYEGYQDATYTTLRTAQQAIEWFRWYLGTMNPDVLGGFLAPLRGKDLACWCPLDQPCHADVLLELANAEEPA